MDFSKGHGTENDFIILPDPDIALDLTPRRVEALCDRRRGIGADGVLRVAKAGALLDHGVLSELPSGVAPDDWFMDYRNSNGSVAEMCGNGVRVFAHYLLANAWEPRRTFSVGSRSGGRQVTVHMSTSNQADVEVDMGIVQSMGSGIVTVDGHDYEGRAIDVGNPHVACVVPELTSRTLSAIDLTAPPVFDQTRFPDGVNIEILTRIDGGAVDMRVYERGVGETMSCGTGTVAAAAAALGFDGFDRGCVDVRVPGGVVTVSLAEDRATVRGQSILLASGQISDIWWNAEASTA